MDDSILNQITTTNFQDKKQFSTQHIFTWHFQSPIFIDVENSKLITFILGETEDDCPRGRCSCTIYIAKEQSGAISYDSSSNSISFQPHFKPGENFYRRKVTLTLHGGEIRSLSGSQFQGDFISEFYLIEH